MASQTTSTSEREFIIDGVAQNFRSDGRGRSDVRQFTLETGIISNTNGSCRLRLGGTDVLVGVKLSVEEPSHLTPDQGLIDFNVECSAAASPAFEARGGQQLEWELTGMLKRISSFHGAVDLKALCIIEGKFAWVVHVDIVILECAGGSLSNAIVLAVKAAIHTTKIPETQVVKHVDASGDGDEEEELDYDIVDDIYKAVPIKADNFPVMVTLTKVGEHYITDATTDEENCASGELNVAINAAGNVCGMQTGGQNGTIETGETLNEMLTVARASGKILIQALQSALKREEDVPDRTKVGFFASS